jgi:hypothetical protein
MPEIQNVEKLSKELTDLNEKLAELLIDIKYDKSRVIMSECACGCIIDRSHEYIQEFYKD